MQSRSCSEPVGAPAHRDLGRGSTFNAGHCNPDEGLWPTAALEMDTPHSLQVYVARVPRQTIYEKVLAAQIGNGPGVFLADVNERKLRSQRESL